jgi:hypothetical protein
MTSESQNAFDKTLAMLESIQVTHCLIDPTARSKVTVSKLKHRF